MQCLLTFPVAVRLIAGFVVVLLSADCLIAAERVLTGHQLFVRQWTPEEGLGPVFNAGSCVACHFQGGIGGGGSNEHNVQLLSVDPPQNLTALERAKFVKRIQAVHPSFSVASPDIVFHKFNVDSTYDQWRRRVLGFVAPKRLNKLMQARFLRKKENQLLQRPVTRLENRGVTMIMSQRNTPALFGAGELDRVPETLLQEIAEQQAKSQSGVSGRFTGKFGWRGQTASLEDFVLGACANELGLQANGHRAASDPMCRDDTPVNDELTEFECHKLVQLVGSLPAPKRRVPRSSQAAALVTNGERLFHTVGCTECHVPNLGTVSDVYSDLLLHDMGSALADPVEAPPVSRKIGEVTTPSSGYFGGGTVDLFATVPGGGASEWKTPPLWGCAASGPYLHDGRAGTLHEAIMLHGGEARFSRKRYIALDTPSKQRLVSFLQSLAPPSRHELPME